jgi:cyanophycinase
MCPAPLHADTPRGFIIPIGGGEDRVKERGIHRRFIEMAGGADADIVVIPTASVLESTGDDYNRMFRDLGAGTVEFLPILTRGDCENPRYVEMLDRATGIFLTGGNQVRLSAILGGTQVAQKIRRRNAAGVPVAGTSAGASIMSEHMVAGGESGASPAEGVVSLAPGLGLTNAVIIDQHFTQRNRLGRLLVAASYNPFLIGLGIDEDTAAFIGPDNVLEVVGSGTVTVVDASRLTHSSIWAANKGDALSLLGLSVDVMAQGCRYDLVGRHAYPPDPEAGFCRLPNAASAPKKA